MAAPSPVCAPTPNDRPDDRPDDRDRDQLDRWKAGADPLAIAHGVGQIEVDESSTRPATPAPPIRPRPVGKLRSKTNRAATVPVLRLKGLRHIGSKLKSKTNRPPRKPPTP